jgi:hypothetical protein
MSALEFCVLAAVIHCIYDTHGGTLKSHNPMKITTTIDIPEETVLAAESGVTDLPLAGGFCSPPAKCSWPVEDEHPSTGSFFGENALMADLTSFSLERAAQAIYCRVDCHWRPS